MDETMIGSTADDTTSRQPTKWDSLSEVEFSGDEIKPEPWSQEQQDKLYDTVDESEPDINEIPQTMWRGERVYLGNIDEVGSRDLSVVGHERHGNGRGRLNLARDKGFAVSYAIGTDGVKFYDGPLTKEEIPIGVIYKINNQNNHLGIEKPNEDPEPFGPYQGKYREFATDVVPAAEYSVEAFYIMDDFRQPGGHKRSDFRRPMEVFTVKNQESLPKVIAAVKRRMSELDRERNS